MRDKQSQRFLWEATQCHGSEKTDVKYSSVGVNAVCYLNPIAAGRACLLSLGLGWHKPFNNSS